MALSTTHDTAPQSGLKTLTGPVLLIMSIAQIVCARLTTFLGVGQEVSEQSAATSHPLVPAGTAFAIWGAIYLYALIAAIWACLPKNAHSPALQTVGWSLSGMYLVNSLWQIWVPLYGIDPVSFVMIATSLILGLTGLMRLKKLELSKTDTRWVWGPMALLTGWITAASFVNFTSALISWGQSPVDPRQVMTSAVFLLALIGFGGWITYRLRSVIYGLTLCWALSWILVANLTRDTQPIMVVLATIGISLIVSLLVSFRRRA